MKTDKVSIGSKIVNQFNTAVDNERNKYAHIIAYGGDPLEYGMRTSDQILSEIINNYVNNLQRKIKKLNKARDRLFSGGGVGGFNNE